MSKPFVKASRLWALGIAALLFSWPALAQLDTPAPRASPLSERPTPVPSTAVAQGAEPSPQAESGPAIADAGQPFVQEAPSADSPLTGRSDVVAPELPSFQTTVTSARPDPALIGASATTVTREQVEALPGGDNQTIANIVTMQPGTVADSFGSNIHVRGADGAITYVIDGIPIFTPPLGTVGQLLNTLPIRLVQNVTVYTGGFPIEYSYSLGGVVDIQSRRPTVNPTAEAQITYGSYNFIDVALNYSQTIGKLSVFASADFISTVRGLDTPNAVGVLHDYRSGGNGFTKLDYEIDGNNRLTLLAIYEQDHFQIPIDPTMLPLSDAPPGAIRGNDVYGNPPPPFVPYDANPTDFERTFFAALSYVHTGDVRTQVSFFARGLYEDFNCDPAGSLGPTADPGSVCTTFTRKAIQFGGLANTSWRWLPGNTWKAGGEIRDQIGSTNASLFTRDDSSPSGGPDPSATLTGSDNINTLSVGVYLEDRIEVGNFTFLPGLRFDVQNTSFGSANEPNLLLSGPSARLGASYALNDAVIFHGFLGYLWEAPVNFDAPVLAPILIPSLAGQPQPADLKPATTLSTELGISVHPKPNITLGLTVWGRWTSNMLDHQNIGNSELWASFNWQKGRAAGFDVYGYGQFAKFLGLILEGFANLSAQDAQQLNINSQKFLFSPSDLTASGVWSTMDHVQNWTANVGLILHDVGKWNNLAIRFNYGSGFHTGIATNEVVPEHSTFDVTLSHMFDLPLKPEVAFDAFNLFNDIYAYRLGTGFFGNSQFAALRRFDLRLLLHFG
ncbi:MAG TPA: TonB-dependent receptor plug domain-containing protein [Candidatus Angelobacter sp.]|nr:TonB-dependent receptor plug domain-containing protein [Candidatus Angelobacter sp.]